LSPVVHSLSSVANGGKSHLLESRRVGLEMICDEMAGAKPCFFRSLRISFLAARCSCGTGPGSQEPRPQHRQLATDTSTFRQLRRTSRPDAIVCVGEAGVSEGLAQAPGQTASPIGGLFRS